MNNSEEWLKQLASGQRREQLHASADSRLAMEGRKEFFERVRANGPAGIDAVLAHHLALKQVQEEPNGGERSGAKPSGAQTVEEITPDV